MYLKRLYLQGADILQVKLAIYTLHPYTVGGCVVLHVIASHVLRMEVIWTWLFYCLPKFLSFLFFLLSFFNFCKLFIYLLGGG